MLHFSELEISFFLRLLTASLCGALIGLERELRAKEAGLRTHFLVALGSALMMIVSQYGFRAVSDPASQGDFGIRWDVARVAAQIVSGIGFIGAGAIMVQRHSVSGLTTAAGLWVVAGIGMAAGGGCYALAFFSTFMGLIGLEVFRLVVRIIRLRNNEIVFTADSPGTVERMLRKARSAGFMITNYKVERMGGTSDALRVTASLRERSITIHERRLKGESTPLLDLLSSEPGVVMESIE
jgi:putative Mg2+ transporter-C (MgtC) family protein